MKSSNKKPKKKKVEIDAQFIVNLYLGNYEDTSLANLTFFIIFDDVEPPVMTVAKLFRNLIRHLAPDNPSEYVTNLFKLKAHEQDNEQWELFEENGFSIRFSKDIPVYGMIVLYKIEDWVADDYNDQMCFQNVDKTNEVGERVFYSETFIQTTKS